MWKSFLGAVRFILTKYDPVSSHGDPIRAKSYVYYASLIFNMQVLSGWVQVLSGWVQVLSGWVQVLSGWVQVLSGWVQVLSSDESMHPGSRDPDLLKNK